MRVIALAVLLMQATSQSAPPVWIEALVQHDYTTAARALQPAARADNPLAAFFLASLYYSGAGVQRDTDLACGLYMRAATSPGPLQRPAQAMVRALSDNHPLALASCRGALEQPWPEPTSGANAPSSVGRAPLTDMRDGLLAFQNGDFIRAAELFRPSADRWSASHHPLAALLTGVLFESGAAGPVDGMRACAYYLHADSLQQGPWSRLGPHMVEAVSAARGSQWFFDCAKLANIGFDHGFEPITFPLAPGDWVTLDAQHVDIMHGGREQRVEVIIIDGGHRFHSANHTVVRSGGRERHFIEVLTWHPRWSLLWRVFEVIEHRFELVAGEGLLTTDEDEPPRVDSDSVRTMAHLRPAAGGAVEWVVARTPRRSGLIPPEEERRERARIKLAREGADATIDWDAAKDVDRSPTLRYVDADGCANTFVYGWSQDRAEVITLAGELKNLGVVGSPGRFPIGTPSSPFAVRLHVYSAPQRSWYFCTDVLPPPGSLSQVVWHATSGSVTIERSAAGVWPTAPSSYRIRISFSDLEFVNDSGVRIKQASPITLSTVVAHVMVGG
jgi:hypothetical protein